jgi:hypothetical protein
MQAPERFVAWLAERQEEDKHGHVYQYHPRSDAHSNMLCTCIVDDLVIASAVLREHAARGRIAYGINLAHEWPNKKAKTIDLALGVPRASVSVPSSGIAEVDALDEVLISCEAKTAMTEHGKSQPRIFDELSSSHEIVHQGRQDAIAAGITVVNIAPSFVSPIRNQSPGPLRITRHKQPHVATRMVAHLRGLTIRDRVGEAGFDAYCTFVVDCDNQGRAHLWSKPPAPQPGDRDHYQTFVGRIARFYEERFPGR